MRSKSVYLRLHDPRCPVDENTGLIPDFLQRLLHGAGVVDGILQRRDGVRIVPNNERERVFRLNFFDFEVALRACNRTACNQGETNRQMPSKSHGTVTPVCKVGSPKQITTRSELVATGCVLKVGTGATEQFRHPAFVKHFPGDRRFEFVSCEPDTWSLS